MKLKRIQVVLSSLASIAYQEESGACIVFCARVKVEGDRAEGIVMVRRGTPDLSGPRHNELLNAFFCVIRMDYPSLIGCTLKIQEGHV